MSGRPSRWRDLTWRAEAYAFDVASFALRLLPVDWASSLGAGLFRALGPLTSSHRIAARKKRLPAQITHRCRIAQHHQMPQSRTRVGGQHGREILAEKIADAEQCHRIAARKNFRRLDSLHPRADRHQYRTDTLHAESCRHPFVNIWRPDRDTLAMPDAKCQQSAADTAAQRIEFGESDRCHIVGDRRQAGTIGGGIATGLRNVACDLGHIHSAASCHKVSLAGSGFAAGPRRGHRPKRLSAKAGLRLASRHHRKQRCTQG